MDGIRIALLDVMGTTIATYLHTCLSGYVTCKHNLGPVNCVCLPCDSSPITERVCTHNTQPSDRVNLFIYYHDLNTFRHLDRQAFYANSWPNSRRNAIVARFEARLIQSSIARRRRVSIRSTPVFRMFCSPQASSLFGREAPVVRREAPVLLED